MLRSKLVQLVDWLLQNSNEIAHIHNELGRLRSRIEKLEEAKEEAEISCQVSEKDKRIYGDHA